MEVGGRGSFPAGGAASPNGGAAARIARQAAPGMKVFLNQKEALRTPGIWPL